MEVTELSAALVKTIRLYHNKGWSPATSTNYSFKDESNRIWVTRSGIDKSQILESDFILVDEHGQMIENINGQIPSAETKIHCCIYSLFPEAQIVLHSHGKYPLLAAEKCQDAFVINGWEVQKGFTGVESHLSEIRIPITENSQNMEVINHFLQNQKFALKHHCFIIRGHGTYAWGRNLFEAKRHLETLDYLCEIKWELTNQ